MGTMSKSFKEHILKKCYWCSGGKFLALAFLEAPSSSLQMALAMHKKKLQPNVARTEQSQISNSWQAMILTTRFSILDKRSRFLAWVYGWAPGCQLPLYVNCLIYTHSIYIKMCVYFSGR